MIDLGTRELWFATGSQIGNRFRMIVNQVNVVKPDRDLSRSAVACAVWVPDPDLPTAAAPWIHAGGARHTDFSQSLTVEHLQGFAEMADMELLWIDKKTQLRQFRNEPRWNAASFC